jgi:hypothetical protein
MDWQSRDIGWGRNLQRLQRRYEAEGRVSEIIQMLLRCAAAENDDRAGRGADNMKQQGWLPKIVPQPKEAMAPCLFKDPGAFWWWRSKTLTLV